MKQPKMKDLKYNEKKTKKMRESMAQSKKVKITINFDAEILNEIKDMAKEMGSPYQTLLNKIVKDALLEKALKESRLDHLEKELAKLKKKIA
jgi:predicted DNA binding CopG/RHH family protein